VRSFSNWRTSNLVAVPCGLSAKIGLYDFWHFPQFLGAYTVLFKPALQMRILATRTCNKNPRPRREWSFEARVVVSTPALPGAQMSNNALTT